MKIVLILAAPVYLVKFPPSKQRILAFFIIDQHTFTFGFWTMVAATLVHDTLRASFTRSTLWFDARTFFAAWFGHVVGKAFGFGAMVARVFGFYAFRPEFGAFGTGKGAGRVAGEAL
jgi:hypothetical protein